MGSYISEQGMRLQSWLISTDDTTSPWLCIGVNVQLRCLHNLVHAGDEGGDQGKAEPLDGPVLDIKHCVLLEMVVLRSAMWFWYLAIWYFFFCNYKL